jgi:5-keto-L-gluconate epimerase
MQYKYSVVVGPDDALPQAFVVFRGLASSIPIVADCGYKGIELAVRDVQDIPVSQLTHLLKDNDMEVSAISTGQVYAEKGLSFTMCDREKRKALYSVFKEIVDLAKEFGGKVNIGRVRGSLDPSDPGKSILLFTEAVTEIAAYASLRNVDIILEPVNRYEINFINNLDQGADLIRKVNVPNLFLMPDLFHMNIEDTSIEGSLKRHKELVNYIHFADSNRHSPGSGHLNFVPVFQALQEMNYKGWISLELLPVPDPETAARNGIKFLKKLENEIFP